MGQVGTSWDKNDYKEGFICVVIKNYYFLLILILSIPKLSKSSFLIGFLK